MLGPFHDEAAHSIEYGDSIVSDGTLGEPTLVRGFVRDTDGNVVPNALIDVWETRRERGITQAPLVNT